MHDDWVDPVILCRLAKLFRRQRSGSRFTVFDPGDETVFIGCASPRELEGLRNLGLPFRWLRMRWSDHIGRIVRPYANR